MSKELKTFIYYSVTVLVSSVCYYLYLQFSLPTVKETETILFEIGESFGEITMWVFVFIYSRTGLKLFMGRGPLARRLLPNYTAPESDSLFRQFLVYLDRSHIYFGVGALALALIHIALMGLHPQHYILPSGARFGALAGFFWLVSFMARHTSKFKKVVLFGSCPTCHWRSHWHFCIFWPYFNW